MKRFTLASIILVTLAMLALTGPALAADYDQEILQTSNASTSTTNTSVSGIVVGEVDTIIITIVDAASTGDVSVVTSDGFTLFAADNLPTGTNYYRVRFPYHEVDGTAIATTNQRAVVVGTVTANFNEFNTTGITANAKINYLK